MTERPLAKRELLEAIVAELSRELDALTAAAKAAREAATHEESKPEDQYDTRGLEASYLAGAQAERAAQIQKMISQFRLMSPEEAPAGAPIALGSLVELVFSGRKSLYFLASQGGGVSVQVGGRTIQVLTPQAPLGEALLGRRSGDSVEVEVQGSEREYLIASVL